MNTYTKNRNPLYDARAAEDPEPVEDDDGTDGDDQEAAVLPPEDDK